MNTNQTDIFETKAFSILGSRTKAIRADLRNLPYVVIDRGRRMSQARIYKTADVLELRKAHWASVAAGIAQVKKVIS